MNKQPQESGESVFKDTYYLIPKEGPPVITSNLPWTLASTTLVIHHDQDTFRYGDTGDWQPIDDLDTRNENLEFRGIGAPDPEAFMHG